MVTTKPVQFLEFFKNFRLAAAASQFERLFYTKKAFLRVNFISVFECLSKKFQKLPYILLFFRSAASQVGLCANLQDSV